MCVVVTTYARPDGLAHLLDDVEREFPPDVHVCVYDDASPARDLATEDRLRRRGWSYRRAPANHGKHGWWRWWNCILEDLRRRPEDLVVVLQDDMRLCEDFVARCLALWSSIDDPRKASLYLHLSEHRAALGSSCWTPVVAERSGRVVHSGWVDMNAFLADRRLFDGLGWRLDPISSRRWDGRDELSSGVGQQISVRAHAQGLGMYRVDEALVVHDASTSMMNPEARGRWPMTTLRFVDGDETALRLAHARPRVVASVATTRRRERGLQRVVESLLPQVDHLQVYLNDYARVPAFLDAAGIEVARGQEHGDRGDAGKFFWAGRNTGYQLVCDDDIAYPADYVEHLVAGIERHRRRAVVGYHGSLLRPHVVDYYRSRTLLHLSAAARADRAVHVLGTGVAGYHTSALPVTPGDFRSGDLADLWLAVLGQRHRVPFVVLEHPAGWLAELPGFREGSLYARARQAPARGGAASVSPATEVVRSQGLWHLYGEPAADRTRPGTRTGSWTSQSPEPLEAPGPSGSTGSHPLVRVEVAGPEHRATLVLPERDHITAAIRRSGTYYERDVLDAVRRLAPPGVYVDVGAHHGNHTAFFALECGAQHVIAIEPSPRAHTGLRLTVEENRIGSRVTLHRVAVHPRWRRVTLRPVPWRGGPGEASTNTGALMAVGTTRAGDAAAAPLDEILDDVGPVGLVKVDVGALTGSVLSSGRATLLRYRPLVVAEAASTSQRAALRALLSPMGYREAGRFGWTPTWLWRPATSPGLTSGAGRA